MLESLPIKSNESTFDKEDDELKELDEVCVLHEEILMESINAIQLAPLYAFVTSIEFKMRSTLFVLYALEFTSNQNLVSLIVGADWIFNGVFALIILYITDIWRYDYMIIICASISVVTCFFESSAWSFTVLAIAWSLSDQPTQSMFCAYICHILPVNLSKQYVSFLYQSSQIAYAVSPVLGGIIVHYSSYRTAFWVAFGLAIICLIICLYMFIRLDQSRLQEKQLLLQTFYQRYNAIINRTSRDGIAKDYGSIDKNIRWKFSNDFRFPVVLSHQAGQDPDNGSHDYDKSESESEFSGYQLFLVLMVSLQFGLTSTNSTLLSMYHTVYMTNKYDCNIIISTAQISVLYIFFAIGMKIIQLTDEKISEKRDNIRKYDLSNYLITGLLIAYVICIILTTVIIYYSCQLGIDTNYVVGYFIVFIIYGTLMGILYMIQNILLILVQPRLRSGTIGAMRTTIKCFSSAISLTVVGILYSNQSKQWVFYWQAVNYSFSLIFLIAIIVAEML